MSLEALTFGRLRGFGARERVLLLVSLAASTIYFLSAPFGEFPGRIVCKALSILPLALMSFGLLREGELRGSRLLRDNDSTILAAALVFSSLGDVLLDWNPRGLFVFGLLAFLTAHFIYILLFVSNWPRPLRPDGAQLFLFAVILLYSLLLANWFAPSLGTDAKPVMLYICVITVMVITTILSGFPRPWVCGGAILFLISDSLIAINRYKMIVPGSDSLVWATYYLGQYGLAIGFLREKLGDK